MLKRLKLESTIGALALALAAASPAIAASAAPKGASETAGGQADFAKRFWIKPRMKAMDTNKDGMVSRDEYMDYMGKQYDMMDHGKKNMLDAKAFTDSRMMRKTFYIHTE
jgi:hypothetical protein